MKYTYTSLILVLVLEQVGCGNVPRTSTHCASGFRNGTQGILSDADLQLAWGRAQQTIVQGKWVINALSCDSNLHTSPPPCQFHTADPRASSESPDCVSIAIQHGLIDGQFTGEQSGNAIIIDADYPHDRVVNLAQWEFENVIGERLGFPVGDR